MSYYRSPPWVGNDVDNGFSAIHGARYGAYQMLSVPDWDYRIINDYDRMRTMWHTLGNPEDHSRSLGLGLKTRYNMVIADLDSDGSKFYKTVRVPKRDNLIR